jgi:hypothetical protein
VDITSWQQTEKYTMASKIFLFFFLISIYSCAQETESKNELIIDNGIIEKVKSELSKSENSRINGLYVEYEPSINPNIQIDSLELKAIKQEMNENDINGLFSNYIIDNDSIFIKGIPGILSNEGFSIKLKGNKYEVSAYFIENMIYSYSLNKSDKTNPSEIEVPCQKAKLILSEYPIAKSKYFIYGILEFETHEFYLNRQNFGLIEKEDKTKHNVKMKVYFKSYYFD